MEMHTEHDFCTQHYTRHHTITKLLEFLKTDYTRLDLIPIVLVCDLYWYIVLLLPVSYYYLKIWTNKEFPIEEKRKNYVWWSSSIPEEGIKNAKEVASVIVCHHLGDGIWTQILSPGSRV